MRVGGRGRGIADGGSEDGAAQSFRFSPQSDYALHLAQALCDSPPLAGYRVRRIQVERDRESSGM
jgi:hypothetical protein